MPINSGFNKLKRVYRKSAKIKNRDFNLTDDSGNTLEFPDKIIKQFVNDLTTIKELVEFNKTVRKAAEHT